MARILVSGSINIETTVQIDGFPLNYFPVRYPFFGLNTTVSGVGYNVACALHTLGNSVKFLSLVGRDVNSAIVRDALTERGIYNGHVISALSQTAQSVILYAPDGRRQIHVDLKDNQTIPYPIERFETALTGCDVAVLCNINYSRPFLSRAHQSGKLVATDVHAIGNLDDDYNRDFMANADILFMSDEHLPTSPEHWSREVFGRYGAVRVVVVGMGEKGAFLAVRADNAYQHFPAVLPRPLVNTIGAGDSLFSAFVHEYARHSNPYEALRKAIVFAGYKIGANGGAEGFLKESELDSLYARMRS